MIHGLWCSAEQYDKYIEKHNYNEDFLNYYKKQNRDLTSEYLILGLHYLVIFSKKISINNSKMKSNINNSYWQQLKL